MIKKIMIAAGLALMSLPALAGQTPDVLYMEVDQGKELLDRHSQAFQRIFDHTGNYLHHQNIHLYEDESPRSRNLDDALDTLAEGQNNGLDAAVFISVKHDQNRQGTRMKDRLIAIARIVNPQSLKTIDVVRVKSPVARVHIDDCRYNCQEMILRRHVREVLPKFKEKLVKRLHRIESFETVAKQAPTKLTLTLKGFKAREIRHLEDRIAALDGTHDLSWLASREDKPAYWIERRKNAPDIRDDLSQVLAELDLSARIVQTERRITLIKLQRNLAYLD